MKKYLLISLFFVGLAFQGFAQPGGPSIVDVNARVKALYIYNFAKGVDFPTEKKKGNFVIGVIGNDAVYSKLVELYSSKSIGSQPIEIKKFTSASSIQGCHLIYVSNSQQKALPGIVKDQLKSHALIVGEGKETLEAGATINFVFVNEKLKYTLSEKNAEKCKLFITAKLVEWAEK